jgi:hypothetical protein
VTVTRTEDRVAYARVSDNGTAGIVDVRCVAAPGGTTVHVTYDLTATNTGGSTWLEQFFAGYDDMLEEWRNLTLRLLE